MKQFLKKMVKEINKHHYNLPPFYQFLEQFVKEFQYTKEDLINLANVYIDNVYGPDMFLFAKYCFEDLLTLNKNVVNENTIIKNFIYKKRKNILVDDVLPSGTFNGIIKYAGEIVRTEITKAMQNKLFLSSNECLFLSVDKNDYVNGYIKKYRLTRFKNIKYFGRNNFVGNLSDKEFDRLISLFEESLVSEKHIPDRFYNFYIFYVYFICEINWKKSLHNSINYFTYRKPMGLLGTKYFLKEFKDKLYVYKIQNDYLVLEKILDIKNLEQITHNELIELVGESNFIDKLQAKLLFKLMSEV